LDQDSLAANPLAGSRAAAAQADLEGHLDGSELEVVCADAAAT
jgi:hypothetical protein